MAHPDLDTLLNALIPFAQQQIGKRSTFTPFGAMLSIDNEVMLVAGEIDHSLTADAARLQLEEVLLRESAAGNIRAAGICIDTRLLQPDQTDMTEAICVCLEHKCGESADIYLPYKKGWFRKVIYGELFGTTRERRYFR